VLKDYVKALAAFVDRADARAADEAVADELRFNLLDSLGGLPPERAADILVEETRRLARQHGAYVERLIGLVGNDEAIERLKEE